MFRREMQLYKDDTTQGVSGVDHESAAQFEVVDEIPTDSLEHPRVVQARNGELAFGTAKGGRSENQDRLVVNTDVNGAAVVDGAGGMGKGDVASQILAGHIQEGFRDKTAMDDVQRAASQAMNEAGVGKGGACYITFLIEGKTLNVYQAGDVRLAVINRKGEVKFQTKDEAVGPYVRNAVQGTDAGTTAYSQAALEVGDTIIVGCDGLWKNLDSKFIMQMAKDYEVGEALEKVYHNAMAEMDTSGGNPDNITILMYRIERILEEEGAKTS